MSDPGKAVFLSYASQDAEAARRICEALPPSPERFHLRQAYGGQDGATSRAFSQR